MNHLERWKNTLNRKAVDRPPLYYAATQEFTDSLTAYLGVDEETLLYDIIDIDYRICGESLDFKVLEPKYIGPELKVFDDGTFESFLGVRQKRQSYGNGAYTEAVVHPLANASSVEDLAKHRWPSADWYDYSVIPDALRGYPDYPFMVGYLSLGWFAWELRGMSDFLVDMHVNPGICKAILQNLSDYGYDYFRRILAAGAEFEGRNMVCIHLADDLATQEALLISPEMYREFFKPHYKRIIDLAHNAGAKVEFHCCGSCIGLIPEFIDTGIDILNPVQTSAKDMDPATIKREFGKDLAFSGAVDVQKVLPLGTPASVKDEVRRLLDVLGRDGGYIVGPGHNIQVGTPPENVVAMYEVVYGHPLTV